MSFSLDSCVPAPVCENKIYPMNTKTGIVDIGSYLGDPSKADWVSQGEPVLYNGNILLTMPANSVGTVLASTSYMWYGNVKAKLKTSRGAGVVTAFILFSDVKDEIDYEFVGTELDIAQTNYYFQGIPECKFSSCDLFLITFLPRRLKYLRLTVLFEQTSIRATSASQTRMTTGTHTRSGGHPTRSLGSSITK
jgi:hypothetical protein